jgi:pyruvate/2-oxoglutarate dehydrogenase complex dihydrolipoamide dehydrogenase (E3) component
VSIEKFGIKVNNYLQTENENIFAVGDCLPGHKFTHNSDIHARIVVRNALFGDHKDKDKVILPYCIYTDPEIASVGKNEKQLKE